MLTLRVSAGTAYSWISTSSISGVGYAAVRAPWPLVFGAALRFVFAAARMLTAPTICTGRR